MERRIDGRMGQIQKALYNKKTADECRICCSCLKMCGRCGIMGWKSKGRGGTLVDNEEKKEDGATCCLTLPLKLEKWQSDHLEKRFEIARQLYNTLVHAELKKKCQVERMPEYQEIMKMIDTASNQKEKWALEKREKHFWKKTVLAEMPLRLIWKNTISTLMIISAQM